jgi:phosphate:Na+ symporter
MTLSDFLMLCCGLSLFLFGMQRTEKGLRLAAGEGLKRAIELVTRNRLVAIGVGLGVTLLTQSSSATSVMLVGFASAGLITLTQTLGVILGADIGTTITVQLFAFKMTALAPLFITIGFGLHSFSPSRKQRNIGQLILGFGLVFFGLTIMADAVMPLRSSPHFANLFGASSSPIVLLLIAALFTAIIQSSAATLAIIIALALPAPHSAARIDITQAVALLLGANVGTCATALLSALGADTEGKRVAWAHTLFKLAGALIFLPFIGPLAQLAHWSAPNSIGNQIANAHTIFNLGMAVLFLPFLKGFAHLTRLLVPTPPNATTPFSVHYITHDFSTQPTLALSQARRELGRMGGIVAMMFEQFQTGLINRDTTLLTTMHKLDDQVDYLHTQLGGYLAHLSQQEFTEQEAVEQLVLLNLTTELELIGDLISKDLYGYTKRLISKNLHFSHEGLEEIADFSKQVQQTLRQALGHIDQPQEQPAEGLNEAKVHIDTLSQQLRLNHFHRLGQGLKETVETTSYHLDIIEELRRINTHAFKIAQTLQGSTAGVLNTTYQQSQSVAVDKEG